MANRHTLHISKLEKFSEWLRKDGWEILPPSRNIYEVLRAKKPGRKDPLIIYRKANTKEHLTLADRDCEVVKAFLKDDKKPKTIGDRIRAMSDEELAEFASHYISCGYCDANNGHCGSDCKGRLLKWIQSEAEG